MFPPSPVSASQVPSTSKSLNSHALKMLCAMMASLAPHIGSSEPLPKRTTYLKSQRDMEVENNYVTCMVRLFYRKEATVERDEYRRITVCVVHR